MRMGSNVPHRDAASVHLSVPPDRVERWLRDSLVLASVEEGFEGKALSIDRSGREVQVEDQDGHVRVMFRLAEEEGGTRVAAERDVRPEGPLEAAKHMVFPGRAHDELEAGLDRFRGVVEALESDEA